MADIGQAGRSLSVTELTPETLSESVAQALQNLPAVRQQIRQGVSHYRSSRASADRCLQQLLQGPS